MAEHAAIISTGEIKSMLLKLMKERTVFAPVSNGKKIDYLKTDDVDSIVLTDGLPYKSPKEIFFPRCEKIITFKDGEAAAELSEEKIALFGAKPCDIEALDIMKKIFTDGKFKDPFFEKRYENTLLIGVGCIAKKPGCFCDERETYLNYSDKCDLFLGIKGDGYQVLHVSEKGREEFGYIAAVVEFNSATIEFKPEKTLVINASEEDLFKKIEWENIAEICQGCGMCTFICPTCHCFMFKDVNKGSFAYRYRNWDSCMFPKFTLHASGHNPRAAKHERYRQRVAHKYLYVKENFGHTACTGCGRCVRSCPAGMNIKTVAESVMEELK